MSFSLFWLSQSKVWTPNTLIHAHKDNVSKNSQLHIGQTIDKAEWCSVNSVTFWIHSKYQKIFNANEMCKMRNRIIKMNSERKKYVSVIVSLYELSCCGQIKCIFMLKWVHYAYENLVKFLLRKKDSLISTQFRIALHENHCDDWRHWTVTKHKIAIVLHTWKIMNGKNSKMIEGKMTHLWTID